MDARTTALYEAKARTWIAQRRPAAIDDGRLAAFVRRMRRAGDTDARRVVDLGCGPGWYAQRLRELGFDVTAVDIAAAMLDEVGRCAPDVGRVRADLAALPFANRSLDGAWAINCYSHIPRAELPLALAHLNMTLRIGAPVELTLANLRHLDVTDADTGEAEHRLHDDTLRGRLFTAVSAARTRALLHGAGFEAIRVHAREFWLQIRARCARSLPDLIGPNLRLLVCGLNPSLYSAAVGVAFARPGNRFWPAVRLAGLIARERDPLDAFRRGIGFTDLVKRATGGAAELHSSEYAAGVHRVEALVRRYQPGVICFVGLEGWRAALDRRAQSGWVAGGFGGRPAYLMPSTSGRNARVPLTDLAAHLRTAATSHV